MIMHRLLEAEASTVRSICLPDLYNLVRTDIDNSGEDRTRQIPLKLRRPSFSPVATLILIPLPFLPRPSSSFPTQQVTLLALITHRPITSEQDTASLEKGTRTIRLEQRFTQVSGISLGWLTCQ